MQRPENQHQRRLRVVLLFHGEPLEERSFLREEPGLLGGRPTRVTLGQGRGDTFAVPDAGLRPSYPLLRAVGENFVLRLAQPMAGRLCIAGQSMTVAEFFAARRGVTVTGETVPQRDQELGPDDWGVVATEPSGAIALFFQLLPPLDDATDLRPRGRLGGVPLLRDPFVRQAMAISGAVHAAVLLLAWAAWDPAPRTALDAPRAARLVRLLGDERASQRAATATAEGRGAGLAARLQREHDRRRVSLRPFLSDDEATAGQAAAQAPAAAPAAMAQAPEQPAAGDKAAAQAPSNAAPAPTRPASPDAAPAAKGATAQAKAPAPAKGAEHATQARAGAKPAAPRVQEPPAVPGSTLTAQAGNRTLVVASAQRLLGVSVLSGLPQAQGALSAAQIDKVVTFHQSEIESCYRGGASPSGAAPPSGRVVLAWSIDRSGRVQRARIESSTLRNAAVEGCIVQRALEWRFPPASGNTDAASIPFIFRASSS